MADTDNSSIVEEDEAQLELQLALQRSRRLKQKKSTTGAEKVCIIQKRHAFSEIIDEHALTLQSHTDISLEELC